jgi:hypothetical protein
MEDYIKYAELIKRVGQQIGYERAAICGYDLMYAFSNDTAWKMYKAWERYLDECLNDASHTDELRNGVWVPAVPLE